ncbi:hypothetical protein MSG28_008203 [Choristoneura fumiferana]|uniref:Uncharacterized protein n=1 Tax=Choristoneura fumiferana TaxID=7141 RepID=A0ACC0JAC9_CHOFU|nr:hypothetical protein MSG28_008203 [Choristoneura fumiferana]
MQCGHVVLWVRNNRGKEVLVYDAQIVLNAQSGKELALFKGFTYYCNSHNAFEWKKIWRCTHGGRCTARIYLTPELTMVKTMFGKQLAVYEGFTYYSVASETNEDTVNIWPCTTGEECTACLYLTPKGMVYKAQLIHCHAAPKHIIRDVLLVRNKSGKKLAIVNGYSYYCITQGRCKDVYACTKGRPCKARFHFTTDHQMLRAHLEHMHARHPYVIRNVLMLPNDNGTEVAIHDGYSYNCDYRLPSKTVWRCSDINCDARIHLNKKNVGSRYKCSVVVQEKNWWFSTGSLTIANTSEQRKSCGDVWQETARPVIMVKNKSGKDMVILEGFTFYRHSRRKGKDIWCCTSGHRCRARFHMSSSMDMFRANLSHGHDPPRFVVNNGSSKRPIIQIVCLSTKIGSSLAEIVFSGWISMTALSWEIQLYKNHKGKDIAIVNGYTYYSTFLGTEYSSWQCTTGKRCKARFRLYNKDLKMLKTYSRHEYTYYCKQQCKKSKYFNWYCSTHNCRGCNAKLKLDENFAIMGFENKHTHPPAKYCIHQGQVFYTTQQRAASSLLRWSHVLVKLQESGRLEYLVLLETQESKLSSIDQMLGAKTALKAKEGFEFHNITNTELIPTTKGNYVLRVGHYMYSSNWNRPKDSQDSRLNIGWSQKGQMRLSCAGYTFVLPNHYRRSICKRWYCSTDRPKGCKAFVITKYEEIISINNSHNHPARTPRTILTDENDAISTFMNTNTVSANIITNQMGRQRLVLNGHFYAPHAHSRVTGKMRWRCLAERTWPAELYREKLG